MMIRLSTVLALAALVGSVPADIIHVPADSPTIQIAIHEAHPFDTIIVAPGTYYEAINFAGKVITIQSENPNDPDIVASTIIDAAGLGSVVTFTGGEDQENTELAGFTITGGTIGIDGHTSPATVRDCVIRDNSSTGIKEMNGLISNCTVRDNGGKGIAECDGLIQQCVVDSNRGSGIDRCDGVIEDCRVLNTASGSSSCSGSGGAGICKSDGAIQRCVVSDNYASGFDGCSGQIRQCIVNGNRLYGFYACGSGLIENSVAAGNASSGFGHCSADVLNCTVTGNRSYGFSSHSGSIVQTVIWDNQSGPLISSTTPLLSGTANPFFIQPGYWDHVYDLWVDGDYHLSPDSPYIDAGDPFYGDDPHDPTEDVDGNPRVVGVRVDLGAYEFQAECAGDDFDGDETPDICDRDIDDDGVLNVPDKCDFTPKGIVVDTNGRPVADMNQDCRVDLKDYAVLQRSFFE